MVNFIKSITEQFKPSIVIFCWEGKNSGKRRRDIFQNYKGSRKVKKSLQKQFQWEYPEQEWESFKAQIFRVKEYLEVMPFYEVEIENQEADDIIAYLCNYHFKESDKIIISSDQDYFQLINDSVSVYRPVKKELITKETLHQAYQISSKNWILAKCLMGDKSDEIPGIKGIGMKTAVKLFPNLNDDVEYDIEKLFKESEKNINDKNTKKTLIKHYNVILEQKNKEILQRNYKLMQLMSHQISAVGISEINKIFQNQKPQFSAFKLRLLFMQDNAHNNIKNLIEWQQCLSPLIWKEEYVSDF